MISNIDGEQLLKLGYMYGDSIPVTVGTRRFVLPFVKTFSDVARGKPLLYIDSRGHVGLAVNQDSFSALYHIRPPAAFAIPRKGN